MSEAGKLGEIPMTVALSVTCHQAVDTQLPVLAFTQLAGKTREWRIPMRPAASGGEGKAPGLVSMHSGDLGGECGGTPHAASAELAANGKMDDSPVAAAAAEQIRLLLAGRARRGRNRGRPNCYRLPARNGK